MRIKRMALALALAWCLFLATLLHPAADAAGNDVQVLLFGDSITQGFARDASGNTWGIEMPLHGQRTPWWGYGMHLEQMIRDGWNTESFVFNWGYGGLRTDQALLCGADWDCIDTVLQSSENADMILIMLGANDLYAGISHTSTHYHLSVMLDKSLAAGIQPVLGTITPNTRAVGHDHRIRHNYNPLIRELARDRNIFLADHYAAMIGQWDRLYSSGDGLHLNDTGNRKLAESWFNTFKDASAGISIRIEPAEVRDGGGRWRRTGTSAWFDSGWVDSGAPPGPQTIEFNDVLGWEKPANLSVTAKANLISVALGAYAKVSAGISDSQWVIAFYAAYWNRAADPDGLKYWLEEVQRGTVDVPGIAENFALSDEAKDAYPYFNSPLTATDAERAAFVVTVYHNLLNKEVSEDDPGVEYWIEELRTGHTTPGLVIGNMIYAAIQADSLDWLTVWNKIQVSEYFAQKFAARGVPWTDADRDAACQVLEDVTDNPSTVEQGKARVDRLLS